MDEGIVEKDSMVETINEFHKFRYKKMDEGIVEEDSTIEAINEFHKLPYKQWIKELLRKIPRSKLQQQHLYRRVSR